MKTTSVIKIIFLFLIGAIIRGHAQENRLYSQYMFNGLAINPAYAGNQYQLSVTAMNRAQWTGINGAPVSQTFTVHNGFEDQHMGIGVIVNHDKIGVHDNTQAFASYAHHLKLRNATLSLGLQAGFEFMKSDFTKLTLNDPTDPNLNGIITVTRPNVGAGLFLYNKSGYAGLSVPTIIQNLDGLSSGVYTGVPRARYFIATAGKIITLTDRVKYKPSMLLRYQTGSPLSFDINNTFIFNSTVFAGISYRAGNSVIALLEFQINENFRFGYAFDYSINGLTAYGTTSHEVMLNYRVNFRQSPCHTYY